jgi:hypothetical protein
LRKAPLVQAVDRLDGNQPGKLQEDELLKTLAYKISNGFPARPFVGRM